MCKRVKLILSILVYMKFCFGHSNHKEIEKENAPKLIVVSLDGFRWDYLDIAKDEGIKTPNFDKLVQEGVSVMNGLKNVYITKTFPNHYTIVTGRYEENHGMIANYFFDPLFNESFSLSYKDNKEKKWWDGKSGTPVVPIWKVNELCGCSIVCKCDRKSGTVFWPGSEADELHSTYYLKYNESMSFKDRVDTLIKWFTQEDSINLGFLYFHEPDSVGHKYGPFSNEVMQMIGQIDIYVGYLISQLEEHGLLETSDLIITSDHGMMEQKETIYLADYVNTSLFDVYSSSPVFLIYLQSDLKMKVYKDLKNIPNVDVYLKEDIPPEYHYRNNRRISPIIISAHPFFELCVSREDCYKKKGNHGYNNSLSSMHPIFIARGNSFKKNFSTNSLVKNVDLFPLMAHLLKLPPPPSDGDLSRVLPLLSSPPSLDNGHFIFVAVALLVMIFALVFSICACINYWRRLKLHVPVPIDDEEGRQEVLLTSSTAVVSDDNI